MTSKEHYDEKYFNWQKMVGKFGGEANKIKFDKLIKDNQKVLDFGCGGGYLLSSYETIEKHGVEINDTAIVEAKKKHKRNNLKFIFDDAYKYLSKSREKYDVLIFAHVVGYFENPAEVFEKFKPYFKMIFIELPDFDFSYTNHYRKEEKRSLIFTDKNYINEFNREEILYEIKKAGLTVTDMECRYGQIRLWCICDNS